MYDDFVNDEEVELNISVKGFYYSPATAGDELDWIDKYTIVKDGESKVDRAILTRCKLNKIMKVPYSDEVLNKITGKSDYSNYSYDDKQKLFNKLKPSLLSEIMIAINKIDDGDIETKN